MLENDGIKVDLKYTYFIKKVLKNIYKKIGIEWYAYAYESNGKGEAKPSSLVEAGRHCKISDFAYWLLKNVQSTVSNSRNFERLDYEEWNFRFIDFHDFTNKAGLCIKASSVWGMSQTASVEGHQKPGHAKVNIVGPFSHANI